MNTTLNMVKPLKMKVKITGEGAPLLLVPGGLTGWNSWDPFVDYFIAQHKKVILVQLLNVEYGFENKQLPADYSVQTESDALAATIDSLGYREPLDIVAWSYGALTTLGYVLDHPQNIRTITLIEPPAIWVLRAQGKVDADALQTIEFFKTLHGNISEDMLAGFLKEAGLVQPGQSPMDLPQWKPWIEYRQALRNSPAIVAQRDDLKRLQALKKPVLLVKGTGSAPFLHHIIDGLASNLPNARVIEMPGGHAPHLVSREKFLLELKKFQDESVK